MRTQTSGSHWSKEDARPWSGHPQLPETDQPLAAGRVCWLSELGAREINVPSLSDLVQAPITESHAYVAWNNKQSLLFLPFWSLRSSRSRCWRSQCLVGAHVLVRRWASSRGQRAEGSRVFQDSHNSAMLVHSAGPLWPHLILIMSPNPSS